jgi:hypothetical protein
MRIDSSGNVGIGTSSPEELMHLSASSSGSLVDLLKIDNSAGAVGTEAGIVFECGLDRTARISSENTGSDLGALKFWTAGSVDTLTERMRISSNGQHNTFTDASFTIATVRTSGSENAFVIKNGSSGIDAGTIVLKALADGDIENANNSYSGISDIKLKENIVDANSQWNDLKALQVRNYTFKAETGFSTHTQIGLIAQEVESVSPGLVSESTDRDEEGNDLGTTTKSVNYSVLYMKAVKALQEAMERIETLEAKVAALEAE